MRIELLRYFYIVSLTESISSASKHLYISQQGLDNAIKRLEKELDTLLFLRSKTGITLTEEGKILQKFAKEILTSYETFEIELNAKKLSHQQDIKTITIAINALYSSVFACFFEDCLKDFPQIQCVVDEIPNEKIPQAIAADKYHIGIISYNTWLSDFENVVLSDIERFNLNIQPLYTDELVMFIGRQNELAKKSAATDEDLLHTQIILSNNTLAGATATPFGAEIILNSSNFTLQQYYLTTQNCISSLPYLVGKQAFDDTKISYCHHNPPLFNQILWVSQKAPSHYTNEEKLFFHILSQYLLVQ